MTLHAQSEFTIPEETVRVARAAYPRGNTLLKIRDELGTLYQDQALPSCFPTMAERLRRRGAWL